MHYPYPSRRISVRAAWQLNRINHEKKFIFGGAVIAIALTVSAFTVFSGNGEALVEVQSATVARETVVQKVNATGRIQPKTQIRISADVSSRIMALHVEEGDWVEEGQLLVELDRERYDAAVESAQANVRSSQANAKLVLQNKIKTEKDYDRAKDLVARNLESISVLDSLEAAYQVEVARYQASLEQVEQVRAMLKRAEDDLSKTIIYAPMSGTISDLNKEQGEIAIGSQFQEDVILIVADLNAMEALVNVDENDIVNIAIGQQATVEVDALFGQTLSGTVYEIANSANLNDQGTTNQKTEFEVKIAISGEIAKLRPGMTASADVTTRTKENVVAVPIQSVAVRTLDQLTMEGQEVADIESDFTVDADGFVEIIFCIEDGVVVARQVEIGIQSDQKIEIISGIDASEEIVTGSYRAISRDLINGSSVSINNDGDEGDA